MGKNNILFIEIDNTKEDAYRNMEFLNALLYDSHPKCIFESKKQELNVAIKRYIQGKIVPAKIEEPLDNRCISSSIVDVDNVTDECFFDIHIHIRIRLKQELLEHQMMQLHYLSLVLEKHSDLVQTNRLSIFIMPNTGIKDYPFYDETTRRNDIVENYNAISAYLRLIIREQNYGVIYSVCDIKRTETDNIIKALDYKRSISMNTISPLAIFRAYGDNEESVFYEDILDKYIYSDKAPGKSDDKSIEDKWLDNYRLVFQKKIAGYYFEQIQKLRINHRFGFSSSENAKIALADYLFEAAYRVLQRKLFDAGVEIKQYSKEINDLIDGSSIFCFVVFAYVVCFENTENAKGIKRAINQFFALAKEFSVGISQLVQNSLQHSELHFCALSFFVGSSDNQQKLIVKLSDLGSKDILDTFFINLENEQRYIKNHILDSSDERYEICDLKESLHAIYNLYEKMSSNKKQLSYGMFFNDFDDSNTQGNQLWKEFRQIDSSAHVGLAVFAQTIKKCEGIFRVTMKSEHSTLCQSVQTDYADLFMGTNFEIEIPIKPLSSVKPTAVTKVAFSNEITENYQSYAKYLDYRINCCSEERISRENIQAVLLRQSKLNLTRSLEKFSNQFVWTRFWLTAMQTIECFDTVYSFDMKKLFDNYVGLGEADCEMITKGLINAVDVFSRFSNYNSENDILFAFTNLSEDFFSIVIQLTISLALKSFPNNVQLFFVYSDADSVSNRYIHLLGDSYGEAVCNSFHLSFENGSKSYEYEAFSSVKQMMIPSLRTNGGLSSDLQTNSEKKARFVFPFTSFISQNNKTNLFFSDISRYAEKSILNGEGYKLSHSHTRLGNKVHIDAFYEMSFVFYRTIVANRIAFEILRMMLSEDRIGKKTVRNANLLFLGYASYSEAILISITDILKAYRGKDNRSLSEYALYQYNLRTESQSEVIEIQMSCEDKGYDNVRVVQIVPISSTMTTFEKIWNTFRQDCIAKGRNNHQLLANYTAFWAKAHEGSKVNISAFYKEYNDQTVSCRLSTLGNNRIKYIMSGNARWQLPEQCKCCYPENVIDEIPLIETDPTSTVPSQQIRMNQVGDYKIDLGECHENNMRIKDLIRFAHYGHFVRGNNHYQIYIETQKYFSEYSEKIAQWLQSLRVNNQEGNDNYPCLNIIFSPEHNTNVGFSQYVNSHYFNGNAEIISINEDKEFRSNFICEFADLHQMIKRLWDNYLKVYSIDKNTVEKPVRFYFVDDAIISGGTFHKANSFLQSLIPYEYRQYYPSTVFDRCFVLINRMSIDSQQSYIALPDHFHYYCHVDVSNMRKQGDSCTCCKFREDAINYFRKSATNNLAEYWKLKCKNLKEISFDQINSSDYEKYISYLKLVLSHIFKNYLKFQVGKEKSEIIAEMFDFLVNKITGRSIGHTKDLAAHYLELSWKDLIDNVIPFSTVKTENDMVHKVELHKNTIIESLIKVLTRPFFTFEHGHKSAILQFMIALGECLVNNDFDSLQIDAEVKRIVKKVASLYKDKELRLIFLENVLFEAFADLHSTYLMRRQTIEKLKEYIKIGRVSVWRSYLANVQRTIQGSSDETRITRFEYQLLSDIDDYSENLCRIGTQRISERFHDEIYNELFLMNGYLYFEDVQKSVNNNNPNSNNDSNNYYNHRLTNLRKMDYYYLFGEGIEQLPNGVTDTEKAFYQHVHEKTDIDKNHISSRYKELLLKINEMIVKRYNPSRLRRLKIKSAILTNYTDEHSCSASDVGNDCGISSINMNTLQVITMVRPKIWDSKECSDFKYKVKKQIINQEYALQKTGYTVVSRNNSDKPDSFFIICFDNKIESSEEEYIDVGRPIRAICPVYLYVEIDTNVEKDEILWFALRDILSYRDSILAYLEYDFTSDVLSEYARLTLTEAIFHAERAISHTSMKNDNKELSDFLAKTQNEFWQSCQTYFPKLKALEWAYAKNYANTTIAKLYNNMMTRINKSIEDIFNENSLQKKAPKLYINEGYDDGVSVAADKVMRFLPHEHTNDCIFLLFREILDVYIDPGLKDAKVFSLLVEDETITYNYDYIKGIIYQILFDALMNHPDIYDVNFILNLRSHYRNMDNRSKFESKCNLQFLRNPQGSVRPLFEKSIVRFYLEDTNENEDFKWLVIKNILGSDIKYKLEDMYRKLEDPIDYNDGHISVVALYEYTCKLHRLRKTNPKKMFTEFDEEGSKVFVTKLPIIRKDNDNG